MIMRKSSTTTICTCWMSLVLLVIREAVENCSISLLENATTFLNTLPLKSLPTLAETLAANSPATMDARVIITVIASIFAPVRNI